MPFFLIFVLIFLLSPIPIVLAQEVLITPPNPDNSRIQKASGGTPFNQGWNYFTVGFDGCTTLTILNELQADGGSALEVNGIFVKEFVGWQSFTFQSPKQKKVGANETIAFNSNQKFFLQIDEKACTTTDSNRQAQIEKVRESQTAKNNFLEKVGELPVDLWTKLTNIINREGPATPEQTPNPSLENLIIGGKTTVNDLGITGKVTAGLLSLDGLNSTINSLSDIKFNLPNGKVVIDQNGNLNIQKLNIDEENSSIGGGLIQSGSTSVFVNSPAVTSKSRIFVTPTSETGGQSLIVKTKTAGKGFTVIIEKSYSSNITFDWWVIN